MHLQMARAGVINFATISLASLKRWFGSRVLAHPNSPYARNKNKRKNDCRVPSVHVAYDGFTYYPYWISLYKMCKVNGFPGINSAAQLSTVGYSFFVLDINGFFFK